MIDYKSVGLTDEDLREIYKWMDLGRKLDERLWLLNRAGKIPFVVSGQGQEATQIGMASVSYTHLTLPTNREV